MKKAELIEAISTESNLTKMDVEKFLNSFTKVVINNVKEGNKISLSGFGSFEKVERSAREGINPTTKQKIQIKAKSVPKFKAAKLFKETVNS